MSTLVGRMKTRGVEHKASAPTLDLHDISVAYAAGSNGIASKRGRNETSRQYALMDVSFQVETGQHVAVVGPNGAGKSTLFKVIVGTVKPSKGQVNVYGHDPDQHICIAYVPQRSQIDWSFPVTVEDVVMMGRVGQIGLLRWPKRRDWEFVRNNLERVGVAHLARQQIGELSGGQQQRVFIARALAQGADLLMLDEPFSGLDVPSHDAILDILDSLHGVTTMVATHDLNLAAERFDLVMLLNRRVISYGPPAAALTTQNLLKAFGGQMHVIAGEEDEVLLADSCCGHGGENVY